MGRSLRRGDMLQRLGHEHGSVDEMFARVQGSNGADFDLVSIDISLFSRYHEQGLIQPYDMSLIRNVSNLLPSFETVEEAAIEGATYDVPIAWGSQGLIYDNQAFPDGVSSWEALWDPSHAGKVLSLDDAKNSVTNAAIVLGFDDPSIFPKNSSHLCATS